MSPGISLGSFSYKLGDVQCKPEDVPGFAETWRSLSRADFAVMGCDSFRKMSCPVEDYIIDCMHGTMDSAGASASDIDYVVFSTPDTCLRLLGQDFTARILGATSTINSIPVVLSFQQCCSSVSALRYGWDLFSDEEVRNVLVVSFDFTSEDIDRIKSYAFFSDGAASFLISRFLGGDLRFTASAVRAGLAKVAARDSFESRRLLARDCLAKVAKESGRPLRDVTKVFPANLYKPLTLFNAMTAGIQAEKLHVADALSASGHCGNSDWMISLSEFGRTRGISPGETYLIQSSGPGLFACALLAGG